MEDRVRIALQQFRADGPDQPKLLAEELAEHDLAETPVKELTSIDAVIAAIQKLRAF